MAVIVRDLELTKRLRVIQALAVRGITLENTNVPPAPQVDTGETLEEALRQVQSQPKPKLTPKFALKGRETNFLNLSREQENGLKELLISMGIPESNITFFPAHS